MKKLRLYRIVVVLCLIGALITSTSCIRKKKGWGKVVSKNITVAPFDSIEARGNSNIFFKQGNAFKVRIEAPEKMLPYVKVRVENGRLLVSLDRIPNLYNNLGAIHFNSSLHPEHEGEIKIYSELDIKVYVEAPKLSYICTMNNADFEITSPLAVDSLEAVALNNSEIEIDEIVGKSLNISLSNNASMEISKVTVDKAAYEVFNNADATIEHDRSGKVEASTLNNASITLKGTVRQAVIEHSANNSDITNNTTIIK